MAFIGRTSHKISSFILITAMHPEEGYFDLNKVLQASFKFNNFFLKLYAFPRFFF